MGMQAAVHPPTSADEVVVGKLLADVGFGSRAEAGDLAKEVDRGVEAMMGLIVEASSKHLSKDDKTHVLGELIGD